MRGQVIFESVNTSEVFSVESYDEVEENICFQVSSDRTLPAV